MDDFFIAFNTHENVKSLFVHFYFGTSLIYFVVLFNATSWTDFL